MTIGENAHDDDNNLNPMKSEGWSMMIWGRKRWKVPIQRSLDLKVGNRANMMVMGGGEWYHDSESSLFHCKYRCRHLSKMAASICHQMVEQPIWKAARGNPTLAEGKTTGDFSSSSYFPFFHFFFHCWCLQEIFACSLYFLHFTRFFLASKSINPSLPCLFFLLAETKA